MGLIPGSESSPGEGYGNTPVFLPEKSHGQRSLVGYSPWGLKESDMTSGLAHEHIKLHGFSATRWVSFPNPLVDQEL